MWMLLFAACSSEPAAVLHPRVQARDWSDATLLLHELGPPQLSALEPGATATDVFLELPSLSFAYDLTVNPVSGELTLSYTPPPVDDQPGFDRSWIGVLGADGEIERLACDSEADRWCFYPEWSADGESIWYVDARAAVLNGTARHGLVRAWPQTGEVREVVPWATEPAVSPTGEHVAWIAVDPDDSGRRLVLGDSDGAPLTELARGDDLGDLGQPTFTLDGSAVLAVVLVPEDSSLHGLHDRPGAWWRFPVDGSQPEALTDSSTIHYDGVASPDGLVSATREGIAHIDLDSGEATLVLQTREIRALARGY